MERLKRLRNSIFGYLESHPISFYNHTPKQLQLWQVETMQYRRGRSTHLYSTLYTLFKEVEETLEYEEVS